LTGRVRPARRADVPSLVAIEAQALAGRGGREFLERALDDPAILAVVLETAGDEVCGYAVGRIAADELEVHDLAVRSDRRRRGFGGALLDALLLAGSRRGAAWAYLEVRASNRAALALYRARGFDEVGRRPRYYADDGEDAVVLRSCLNPGGSGPMLPSK